MVFNIFLIHCFYNFYLNLKFYILNNCFFNETFYFYLETKQINSFSGFVRLNYCTSHRTYWQYAFDRLNIHYVTILVISEFADLIFLCDSHKMKYRSPTQNDFHSIFPQLFILCHRSWDLSIGLHILPPLS